MADGAGLQVENDIGAVGLQGQLSVPLSITNTAADPGMALGASVSSVSGPIFGAGQVIGLQPGQTDSSDIVLNLQPGAVGHVAGSATLQFTDSDASGITAVATGTVQVSGTFYRLASSTFRQTEFWAH